MTVIMSVSKGELLRILNNIETRVLRALKAVSGPVEELSEFDIRELMNTLDLLRGKGYPTLYLYRNSPSGCVRFTPANQKVQRMMEAYICLVEAAESIGSEFDPKQETGVVFNYIVCSVSDLIAGLGTQAQSDQVSVYLRNLLEKARERRRYIKSA